MEQARQPNSPASAGSIVAGRRETQRARVQLAATLAATTRDYPVILKNISCTGAMAEGDRLPPTGQTVALRRGGMDELAEVVWVRGSRCGIHFLDAIAYERVLEFAGLAAETPAAPRTAFYVAPSGHDDRPSAEDWARAKLRASRMRS